MVTEAGLAHLKNLKQLELLSLHGIKIGGTGIRHLKAMKRLRILTLSHKSVTDAGVQALQEALPRLTILK
jgi:hypothetical protein